MNKRNTKKLLLAVFLLGGLFFAHSLLAQTDFGTGAVTSGLGGSLATSDPRTIIGRIINIALGFLGVIAVGLILFAGFKWMTSNGDEDKINDAKTTLKNGVIGLAIILSSWAIATFILSILGGTINPSNQNGCINETTEPCGCGGFMTCTNDSWGSCIGSNLNNCIPPKTCNSNTLGSTCQPVNQICSTGYFCDNSCACQPQGNAGDTCDSDETNSTCDADNSRCSTYTTCDPATCLCVGSPVITGVSPVGGFCNNNNNKSCLSDDDCGTGDTCDIETANGAANNFVTVSGKNFGEYSTSTSQLIFLGGNSSKVGALPTVINPACVDFWDDSQIIIAVPTGVQSGPVQVINKDNFSDKTDDDNGPKINDFVANSITRPGLCSLNPTVGALSSEVNYQGINLYSGKAYFGNYSSNVSALYSTFVDAQGLSGTSTTPNIRAGESGSFVKTMIAGSIQKSNFLQFTKAADENSGPYIISFTPVETLSTGQKISRGSAGQYVTISGAGFGGAKGNNHVHFVGESNNKIEASYSFPSICANSVWSDNQIIVKVPEMNDGNYQIQITLGEITITTQNLNPNVFTFDKNAPLKPSLCKMDPKQGPVDTPVTFWGEYFGTNNSNGKVRFTDGQDAAGTIGEENKAQTINTNVPAKALTGPVKVVSNKGAGNELNFSVGECAKDDECDGGICCPQNTYKKGMCVTEINKCFSEVKTSVFEWGFSTKLPIDITPFDSCRGLSKYLGACYQGASCPNSPGACSSPSTSYQETVGTCDISCKDVSGCNELTCTYNATLDSCVKNKTAQNGVCDLGQSVTFLPSDYNIKVDNSYATEKTCNSLGKWEISSFISCPIGWTRMSGNKCVQNDVSCNICDANLSCQIVSGEGRCVSAKLCADSKAKCTVNSVVGEADKCVIDVEPGCECCCRIGYDQQDCCAGLTCSGKCGSDIINNSNTYGSCSGCAQIGTTVAEHDAGCNCSGHGSQYCEINNENPEGICTDCSGIDSQADCGDHSSACCFDSNKTATTTDDYCRGVNGSSVVSTNKNNPDYGYCAYYGCFSASTTSPNYPSIPVGDPYKCASTTPVRIGFFNKVDTCVKDCPTGVGTDVCRAFDNNKAGCSGEASCCFDRTTSDCLTGNQIANGANQGFCAYYGCGTGSSDSYECNPTPTTTPRFANKDICTTECANPPKGDGLDCGGVASSTCNFNLCNKSGFACLQNTKDSTIAVGGKDPNCGTCCCKVGLDKNGTTKDSCYSTTTPTLYCKADQGSCSGASRGLCCGCSSDNDCGSISTTGCGSDTCCAARPSVTETLPAASETNVCRNAAIKVSFNQKMDASSLSSNFLLFAELNYGEGTCPSGMFLADNRTIEDLFGQNNKNIFARLWESINSGFHRLFGQTNNQALAEVPSDDKLYCRVPGAVSFNENGSRTDLVFYPTDILSPATKYYAVVKGDENLNSQTGVLSSSEIGMNGNGFNNDGTFIAGNQIKFNKLSYPGSYSFQFVTLSDQGINAGICIVDHVSVGPASYLFNTTTNSLDENDSDIGSGTFDKVADRDKLFVASAYSSDSQLLSPVRGYNWNWAWSVDNPEVVDLNSSVIGLTENKSFVEAKAGVTDSETKLRAIINMDNFRPANGCTDNCNKFFVGDEVYNTSDLYVFVCENPWPAVESNGTWSPWKDVAGNCSAGSGACDTYNYKFYYCRDAGSAGTLDDLPAISSTPVTRGLSLVCSSDKTACTTAGAPCGTNGVCLSGLLKESYFFRGTILPGGNITSATSTDMGGEVKINWQSPVNDIYSYKIYYLRSGKGSMMSKEVKVADACDASGSVYNCTTNVNGLINDQLYIFKLTVVSTNKTESALSSEKTATPEDKLAPLVPAGLKATVNEFQVNFSWPANTDDTAFYRLYYGISTGKYAASFDSDGTSASLSLPLNQFPEGLGYFALSAVDSSKNESAKSTEPQYYQAFNNYWYPSPNQLSAPAGSDCLVKLSVNSITAKVNCDVNNEDIVGSYFGFFTGIIKDEESNPYCSTKDCPVRVNANKCRWWNLDWNNQCYIHN